MNPYIGHDSQLYGVEEHRLVGGKGDGMRIYQVNNGKGMELTICPDRCCDIPRLRFKGINLGYMSPCGYAAPAYYEGVGDKFLKTFTAGFLTTCGLQAVGTPGVDEGEELPLHGSIGQLPCEQTYWTEEEGKLIVHGVVKDETIFGRKLRLTRKIIVSLEDNSFEINDLIENTGDRVEPLEVLYHMNMGYPLLSEQSELIIPSDRVIPRNAHAAEGLQQHLQFPTPTPGYEEQCYFHEFDHKGLAKIYNHGIGLGLAISFDPKNLNSFCQWKMPGAHDYVLGLEPGNCTPDGRVAMREQGRLQMLNPGEKTTFQYDVVFYSDYNEWKNA